ncbi:hypothetical protein Q4524_15110 [Alteromonas stellipolaris]|uniref:hypothetical protein n=1 Tax=Alteromonas stellipolaris TaxID=233316 RepID=UPI0026E48739|nr:hypothetical protein [Alteromonas stellipolaris]MDO6539914.1 hypothetical protein [Alteromonas stellipolaris]
MTLYKLSWMIFLLLANYSVLAQETYFKHQSLVNNEQTPSIVSSFHVATDSFVGCIDYKITYSGLNVLDEEAQSKIAFLIENNTENLGVNKSYCFNEFGDKLEINYNANVADKTWYFADTNEEYTLFKSGIMKFGVNNVAEPEGFEGLAIKKLEVLGPQKEILGYQTNQVLLVRESGIKTEFWVSDKLLRHPLSYQNNKFGYANEIYDVIKGAHLYQRKVIGDLFIIEEEATAIHAGSPDKELFILPNVDLYHW